MEKLIISVLTVFILIEGFEGEFSNPSVTNIIKWIATIIMLICYVITERMKKSKSK